MIGRLGEVEIAAVGLSNQIYFVFILIVFGISTGSAIFTAQYWGAKNEVMIQRVQGLSIILSSITGLIFGLAAFFFPDRLLRIYINDQLVIQNGISYLRIAGFSYIFTACSVSYSLVLRTINRPYEPLIASIFSMLINITLNWVLIFGKLGFSPMGVRGAAIGTLVARIFELSIIIFLVYRNKFPNAGTFRSMFLYNKEFISMYFKTIFPVILNEMVWAVGMTLYSVIYGRVGTKTVAAYEIANTMIHIAFIFYMGTANAASVMIGNRLGYGAKKSATLLAYKFIVMAPIAGFFIGLLYLFLSNYIPNLYAVSEDVKHMIKMLMIALSIIIVFKGINLHLVVGIFRSGGDTKFCLFFDIGSVWFIGIPMAILGAWVLKLPIYIVYLMANSEEIVKVFIGLFRLRSGLWINKLTDNPIPNQVITEFGRDVAG